MKKRVCWLLMGLLLIGCAQPPQKSKEEARPTVTVTYYSEPTAVIPPVEIPAVSGYDDFMMVLFAELIDGTDNKNLSPVSVYLALAMTAEGARGRTLEELLALLGEDDLQDMRAKAEAMLESLRVQEENSELMMADSIWLGEQDGSVSFHKAYLDILKGSYDAQARSVRFGEKAAEREIEAWIREKTRDKVDPSEDAMTFDSNTLAVLINTIYLKDGWRVPFDEERTEEGTFFGSDGRERKVRYMRRTDKDVGIVRGNGFLRYALPLDRVGRMVFVLPDEDVSLQSLLGSPEKIGELLRGGEVSKADVDVMVPKFSFQDRTNLEKTLFALGVRTCFTGDADFTNMTDIPVHISRVLQESYIGVDEKGVEAAAYTMVTMTKNASVPVERQKVDFHLTRPFLYFIESWDGTVLFVGTVAKPV